MVEMKQLHWSRPHQVQINLCPRSEFTSTLVCFGFLSLQGWLEVRSIRFLAPQTNVYSLRINKKIINISENLNQVYFILGVWGSPSQINPNTGQCELALCCDVEFPALWRDLSAMTTTLPFWMRNELSRHHSEANTIHWATLPAWTPVLRSQSHWMCIPEVLSRGIL